MHDLDPEFAAAAKALCELADAADVIRRTKTNAERRFKARYFPDADRVTSTRNGVGTSDLDGKVTVVYLAEESA